MRLHNMVCFPVPTVGLAGLFREPSSNVLYNQGTKIHFESGLRVMQLFLLKKGKPNGQRAMMSVITGNIRIEFGHKEKSLGSKCGES